MQANCKQRNQGSITIARAPQPGALFSSTPCKTKILNRLQNHMIEES